MKEIKDIKWMDETWYDSIYTNVNKTMRVFMQISIAKIITVSFFIWNGYAMMNILE